MSHDRIVAAPAISGGGSGRGASIRARRTDPCWPWAVPRVAGVPREAGWAPEQRPRLDSTERSLTSHTFEELRVHSMNPAQVASAHPPAVSDELATRLIIAIGLGVHSGKHNVSGPEGVAVLPIFKTLMATFLPTAQPWHWYRFYFGFDHNDPVYEKAAHREAITKELLRQVAEEDARRWHPAGSPNDTAAALDGSHLFVTVHWVRCDYSGKPAWAHNDAVMAAYKEGADYAFRTNDDSKFPEAKDWADKFIDDLRSRMPVENLGVVGPACNQGAASILTHDFTHRTHAVIFGYLYPRSLPDWSSDDWITYVYEQYGLMSKRQDAMVIHTLGGTRYTPQNAAVRIPTLNSELAKGITVIDAWTQEHFKRTLPHSLKNVTCC